MAIHRIALNDMKEKGMYAPIRVIGSVECDVLGGRCKFNKAGRIVTPAILHFATWTERYLYLRECLRIERGREISVSEDLSLRLKSVGPLMRQKRSGAARRIKKLFRTAPKKTPAVETGVLS
jgi:hypothetical protein